MTKPTVAITTWKRYTDTFLGKNTPNYTLMEDYAEELEKAGALTILIARLDPEDADTVLDQVDGLVLTGGGDVDPASYNEANADSSNMDPMADLRDIALVRGAREREMPVLGICRGQQIVNVALGGSLHQDMVGVDDTHPRFSDDAEERNAYRHVVRFDEGSQLGKIYGAWEKKVNSLHHQSVDRLGEGLKSVGWTSDGHIEAIESTDSWPLLSVQWHPEMLHDGAEERLFSTFVDNARAYANR